jgi:hypothetical protein
MGVLFPLLIVGGLFALAGSSSSPGNARTWNPAGFVSSNIYVFQAGDENIPASNAPPEMVLVLSDVLSVEQLTDVIEPFAQGCLNQFFLVVGSENYTTFAHSVGGTGVNQMPGKAVLSRVAEGSFSTSDKIIDATPAAIEAALEGSPDCYASGFAGRGNRRAVYPHHFTVDNLISDRIHAML